MELYNVKLTEREVKEVGGVRWQRASWKRWCFYALTSIALLVVGIALTESLTEIGIALSRVGIIASVAPVGAFAFWFLARYRNEGRKFLEKVKHGGV